MFFNIFNLLYRSGNAGSGAGVALAVVIILIIVVVVLVVFYVRNQFGFKDKLNKSITGIYMYIHDAINKEIL